MAAGSALDAVAGQATEHADVAAWETTNLHTIATALVRSACEREETRGSHWREDFPDRDDERWARHLDVRLVEGVPALHALPILHRAPA
jgi:L-aspartate oxidase